MPRVLISRSLRAAAILSFALVVLALPELLLGRAGGGEGFSGGGGGGGGKSGDGDGVIWLIFQLFRLIIYYPKVGIPVALLVCGFFVFAYVRGKDSYQSSVIRRADANRDMARQPQIVEEIQQNDPQFDPDAFLGRVNGAFEKIQHAWAAQDLSDARPFISDAVLERFSLQFEEQRALGYRNRMDEVSIVHSTITHARADQLFDELAVRIQATAIDQKVALSDGRTLSGSSTAEPFVEVWTFLRRRGAQTHAERPGLMEGNCPNCAAPIEMNQSANCKYCSALLRSGQYDWVLVEITQACEWESRERTDVPGAATLRGRDPEFNPQELEDRASVVFWRRSTAERVNSSKPLRKVALESFCEQFDQAAKAMRGQRRTYLGESAVGSVELRGVIPAERTTEDATGVAGGSAGNMDRALVEIRWSGRRFTVEPDGKLARGQQSTVACTLFVLARSAVASTNPDQSIASAHCPTCGAPEEGGASGACQFCGTVLNDGSKAWALAEVADMLDERADELLAQAGDGESAGVEATDQLTPIPVAMPPPIPSSRAAAAGGPARNGPPPLPARSSPSSASVLAWMVKMTMADGHCEDTEREMLQSAATRYGVSKDRLEQMIAAASSNSLNLPPPADTDEARSHLQGMARVALADGKLSREEYTLLRSTGQRLGLTDHDVKQLLHRTKATMYTEAKTELRTAKRQAKRRETVRQA